MKLTNIALRTNLDKMPESCKECSYASNGYSALYMQQAGYPEVLQAYCIYGMDVYTNVKSNTRHEDCPLIDLDDEPCDDVVLPSESFAKAVCKLNVFTTDIVNLKEKR